MASNKISSEDRAWQVLDYEVLMFLGTSHIRKNLKGGTGPNTQIIRNALVESTLLHIRILADIFLDRGKTPDDIRLHKLELNTQEGEGKEDLTEKIDALAGIYGNSKKKDGICWIINKMLAHPTSHRSDSYNYSEVFTTLDKPLGKLIEYVYSSKKRQLPFPLAT